MKTLKSIESSVLRILDRVITESNGELKADMLELAAIKYQDKYGYVPAVWANLLTAAARFRLVLLGHGYEQEDLRDMTIMELRDAVSDLRLVEAV